MIPKLIEASFSFEVEAGRAVVVFSKPSKSGTHIAANCSLYRPGDAVGIHRTISFHHPGEFTPCVTHCRRILFQFGLTLQDEGVLDSVLIKP